MDEVWLYIIGSYVVLTLMSLGIFNGDNGTQDPPVIFAFVPVFNILSAFWFLINSKCSPIKFYGEVFEFLMGKINTDYVAIFLPVACVLTLFLMG